MSHEKSPITGRFLSAAVSASLLVSPLGARRGILRRDEGRARGLFPPRRDEWVRRRGAAPLAPEHRYPTPVHQTMEALDYLQLNAQRLRIDPSRIVLAGDSAGAHIAAQLGALVTTPGYATEVGVTPTLVPGQLRALALACGPFDRALAATATAAAGRQFVRIVLWAYSGTRRYLTDPEFASWPVTEHLTPGFPPTLLTVGNVDPLRQHSELLAERLHALGVPVETLFFPDDHEQPLAHEYQFDLDGAAGRLFLDRLLAFVDARTG